MSFDISKIDTQDVVNAIKKRYVTAQMQLINI